VTNVTDDFKSRGLIYVKIFATHPRMKEQQFLWGEAHVFSEISDNMIVSAFSNSLWMQKFQTWDKEDVPDNSTILYYWSDASELKKEIFCLFIISVVNYH